MSASVLRSARAHAYTPASTSEGASPSKARLWVGRVLTTLTILFLTFDVVIKLIGAKAAVDGTVQLGYPAHLVTTIGWIGAVCLILYVVPRTAPFGALLWTGYLGGAVASNLRLEAPLFSHTLFPIYVAIAMWGGLYLRDARVRAALAPNR
jgi:hypothetical protein